MKYETLDVVNTTPEYGNRTFAIVEVRGNKYYAVALKGQKHYLLEEFQIKERVGRVGDDSPLMTIYDEQEGQKHAEVMAEKVEGEAKDRWEVLACMNPGDKLDVIFNGFIHEAIFIQINLNKPRMVFRARVLDRAYDLPLEAVWVKKL